MYWNGELIVPQLASRFCFVGRPVDDMALRQSTSFWRIRGQLLEDYLPPTMAQKYADHGRQHGHQQIEQLLDILLRVARGILGKCNLGVGESNE